jgi:hypothetical protein
LKLFSLVAAAVLAVMSLAGAGRHEGFTFNQRYLLELLPLAAMASALALDRVAWRGGWLGAGALGGAVLVLLNLLGTPPVGTAANPVWLLRHVLLFNVPLVLAGLLGVAWLLSLSRDRMPVICSVLLGACLGWGMMLHVADDLRASQRTREYNRARTARLAAVVEPDMAVLAFWYSKDAAVPLLLDRDFLILDAHADEGRDAPRLVRALLGRGRRVLLLGEGFPREVLQRVSAGFHVTPVDAAGLDVHELSVKP